MVEFGFRYDIQVKRERITGKSERGRERGSGRKRERIR